MFKETYRTLYDQIHPDEAIIKKIAGKSVRFAGKEARSSLYVRRFAAASVLLFVLVFTATPILAARVPLVYELMSYVSPQIAQYFMPVKKASVDNGIKMEVVSAYIHENKAEIYITLQDLTGNRVDQTTDLYDSYSIRRPFDSSATCDLLGYEEETKTATFLITIEEWGNHNITGDKITFSVREFISDKHYYREIPVDINLADIPLSPAVKEVRFGGGGGPEFMTYFSREDWTAIVLEPSSPLPLEVDGISFTGAGYVDGKLHLQTAVTDLSAPDNHGYFYFTDRGGNKVQNIYSVSFGEESENGSIRYNEFVYDIPQEQIGDYALYGNFTTTGNYTKGSWQVTFPLMEAPNP